MHIEKVEVRSYIYEKVKVRSYIYEKVINNTNEKVINCILGK